ncbi:MAG: rhamnogalacturonan acetylesterase [Terriglobales bacterium]
MRNWMRLSAIIVGVLLCTLVLHAQQPITVYIAGDSTAAVKLPEKRPETGWGELLQSHFDESRVRIEDDAKNGRSTKSFIAEGLWQQIIDKLKPGDYVFVQFGHNDESKTKAERYAPPEMYRANLLRMVNDVRAKQANPVLLTPVARRKFDASGNFVDSHPPEYPTAVRSVADELHVPLIDMLGASKNVLEQYGDERSRTLFLQLKPGENPNYPNGVEDNTHFNPVGAKIMCDLAVRGIRQQKLELAKYLKTDEAASVEPTH